MSIMQATVRSREAAVPLSASAAPGGVYGSVASAGTATTDASTVSASGGTPPYTYAWEYVSGDTATVNSPAASSTTFSRNMVAPGFRSGLYRCRVTDADLTEVVTNNVQVDTEYVI